MSLPNILLGGLYAAIPAAGFAVAFNVPARHLKFCAAGGAIAYLTKTALMYLGMQITWATFIAATAVSFYGVVWAKRHLAHPKVITVASIIPMIPGVYAYKTMIAIVELANGGYTEIMMRSAVDNGLKTVFILGAIAFGLAMPGLLIYRNRPVV